MLQWIARTLSLERWLVNKDFKRMRILLFLEVLLQVMLILCLLLVVILFL